MKYPYIIIDDDKDSLELLKSDLDQFSNYFLIGTADNYDDAINLVLEYSPKIVFIEVDPSNSQSNLNIGFINELFRYVKTMPRIVIYSKSKDNAYMAIKNEIFDYLLKPSNMHEVRKTILKFERNVVDKPSSLCIKSHGDYRFIDNETVVFMQADSNTTDLTLNTGEVVTAFKSLKHFENSLPPEFVRIHNSFIVNINYVARIHLGGNLCFLKNNKKQLPFSKSYKRNVDMMIGLITTIDDADY